MALGLNGQGNIEPIISTQLSILMSIAALRRLYYLCRHFVKKKLARNSKSIKRDNKASRIIRQLNLFGESEN